MTGYVPRYTKRIEQFHKRERQLLAALKRGEARKALLVAAEALRDAKLRMVKSARANVRSGIQTSESVEGKWKEMSSDDIVAHYRAKLEE